jgi:hypothetical protein
LGFRPGFWPQGQSNHSTPETDLGKVSGGRPGNPHRVLKTCSATEARLSELGTTPAFFSLSHAGVAAVDRRPTPFQVTLNIPLTEGCTVQ